MNPIEYNVTIEYHQTNSTTLETTMGTYCCSVWAFSKCEATAIAMNRLDRKAGAHSISCIMGVQIS